MTYVEAVEHAQISRHCRTLRGQSKQQRRSRVEQALQTFARSSEACKRFQIAVKLEHRLDLKTWGGFFTILLRAGGPQMETEIRAWCRSLVLTGETCDCAHVLGRVVVRSDFARFLAKRHRLLLSFVETAIQELTDPVNWQAGVVGLRSAATLPGSAGKPVIELGEHVMWGAFTEDRPDDPLGAIPDAKLIPILGLPPSMQRQTCLVLAYRIAGDSVHYPRIVEAGASASWNLYFVPSDPFEDYGRTAPHLGTGTDGVPEVVHRPVPLDRLAMHVRTLN